MLLLWFLKALSIAGIISNKYFFGVCPAFLRRAFYVRILLMILPLIFIIPLSVGFISKSVNKEI